MWKDATNETPKISQNYNVFGFENEGTKEAKKIHFLASFNIATKTWEDPFFVGKALDNQTVKFWFDFSVINNPM